MVRQQREQYFTLKTRSGVTPCRLAMVTVIMAESLSASRQSKHEVIVIG
jgi:hypothetical protein